MVAWGKRIAVIAIAVPLAVTALLHESSAALLVAIVALLPALEFSSTLIPAIAVGAGHPEPPKSPKCTPVL